MPVIPSARSTTSALARGALTCAVVPRPTAQLYHADLRYYEERASGLLASARDGTPEAVAAFADAGAPLTEAGARRTLAAEHGLTDWTALTRAVTELAEHPPPFARAYRAVEARDPDAAGRAARRDPGARPRPRHQRQRPARAWPAPPATRG